MNRSLFAVSAPGLEAVTAAELRDLEIAGVTVQSGGVSFSGDLPDVWRANLWLRTASRVLLRLGTLRARGFTELERKVALLPWELYLAPGSPLPPVRAASHRSRLFHTGLVAQAVRQGVAARLAHQGFPPPASSSGPGGSSPEPGPTPTASRPDPEAGAILLRLVRDEATVSIDSSGALLHRRGYRQEAGRAPLRETIAAGMLLLARWDPSTPLVDPLCGSGTLLVEAGLLATGRAPGLHRGFAFQAWPCFDPSSFARMIEQAAAQVRARLPAPITGGDRDPRAVAAAQANAARAGLSGLSLQACEFERLEPPQGAGPGLVVANPPYGERLGSPEGLRGLYRRLGRVLQQRYAGWRAALLVGSSSPYAELGMRWDRMDRLSNGGLAVRLLQAKL